MKNGAMIASGTVDELNFSCGTGGTNSSCAETFAANSVSVVTGDRLELQVLPLAGSTSPLGDFNNNGQTDAADYTLWRDSLGSNTPLPNDNGLGTPISQAHYSLWSTNFGSSGGSGPSATPSFVGVDFTIEEVSLSSVVSAVPEPSTTLLLTLVMGALATCYGRRLVKSSS
jgi:hypothetical protein